MTTIPELLTFTLDYPDGRQEIWFVPVGATPESLVLAGRDMLEAAGIDFELGPLEPEVLDKLVDGHLMPADREYERNPSPEPTSSTPPPPDRDKVIVDGFHRIQDAKDRRASLAPPRTPEMATRILAATNQGSTPEPKPKKARRRRS